MNILSKIVRKIRFKSLKFKDTGKRIRVIGFPIYVLNPEVSIGNEVHLYPNVCFCGEGHIIIGDNVKLGNNVIIHASKGSTVRIGCKTIIAANTYIIDSNHNVALEYSIQDQGCESEPIEIGRDCWIGASCVLGKGTKLNDGCVIGANSFVNSEIPYNYIAAGSPAKLIRKRK